MYNTILKAALSCMLLISSVIFFNLGMSWIQEGHGLHPLVSFTLTILCILATMLIMLTEDVSEKDWEI